MTGFQITPRACPFDTQELGFSCICSSSLSGLFLSLPVYLFSSLYFQRLHLLPVFLFEHCRLQSGIKVHRFLKLRSQTAAQFPPSVLPVKSLERSNFSLYFYGLSCSSLTSFLLKWWSHCDRRPAVVNLCQLLNVGCFQFIWQFFHIDIEPERY